jgi:polyhydroxyalkanoate synthesis regulator phasin
MQTQDDEFPYTSEDPSLVPVVDNNTGLSLTPQQAGDIQATLRLLLGSYLNGKDAYVSRLRRMNTEQKVVKPETIKIDENETSGDQLRYLLLGILFETPDLIQRRLSSVDHGSSKLFGFVSKLISPFADSWVFSPVKNQYDHAAARGEKVIDRLIMKGRMEEQNSRQALQQETIDDLINEFVEYLVLKIKVQEIIQQEGASMAVSVVDEFQDQSSNVDTILEQKLKSIFRKSPPIDPTQTPVSPAEGG